MMMRVKELIQKLQELEPERVIEVKVRCHTRRHSVASVTPFEVDWAGIWISLPDNMHVVERNKKEPF